MPTRILIVDDHPLFRDGLHALLQRQSDFVVVGEAATVTEAVRLAQETQPDVVLMDLSLPDGGGVEATRQIVGWLPQVHVIALTVHDEPDMLTAMAQAGAHGYILKETRAADLLRAVRMTVAHGATLSPEMTSDLFRQYRRLAQDAAATSSLSAREQAILRLVAAGASNREIAAQLALSTQTVKNYLTKLYEKLDVHNRTKAVVIAFEKGLLSQEERSKST